RVARDQVERLVCDGLEQVAAAGLDVGEAVQARVQFREGERARVDVRRDDLARALRGEQCLDAAAGADVERAPDAPGGREQVEEVRRRGVRRDPVRRVV